MNKKKSRNLSNSRNEDSSGSSKSNKYSSLTSSSNHQSPRDNDLKEVSSKKKELKGKYDEQLKKRNTINLTRDLLESKIRKSESLSSELNKVSRRRKERSKSDILTSKKNSSKIKIKNMSSDESSSLEQIVTKLQQTIKDIETTIQEEKSNRMLFQILMKNQSEVIETLKEKIASQEATINELKNEISSLKELNENIYKTPTKELKKKDSEKNNKKRSSKIVKKMKSENEIHFSIEKKEKKEKKTKKKVSEKRANSSPSLGSKSIRNKIITDKEYSSLINSPRSDDETDESETSKVTFELDADKYFEMRSSQSSIESVNKKANKKDIKTHFSLNIAKIKSKRNTLNQDSILQSPTSDTFSPRSENGYGSDGTVHKRKTINHKRSSVPRLSTEHIKSPTLKMTESQTRIPHPYILIPDRYKEELNSSSPTPRSLAAALYGWRLNENGIPSILIYWTEHILKEGYNIPDLFTTSLDTHAMYNLKYSDDMSSSEPKEDCYNVAASLIQWFEELPDSLFMVSKYLHWVNAAQTEGEARSLFLRTLYYSLDEVNRILLTFMFEFFDALLSIKGCTITIESIAETFGPVFLRQFKSMSRVGITFGDLIERRNKENNDISHKEKAKKLMMILLHDKTIFNSESIIFEKIGKQYAVTLSSIENLILLLIDTNYTEREFSQIFWTTCNYFSTPTEILQLLINIYNKYDGEQKWMINIKMRVLMAIKTWIKSFSHILATDSSFRTLLEEFKEKAKNNNYFSNNEDQVFQSLVNLHTLENPVQFSLLPIRKVVNPNNIVIDQFEPKQFAIQLLLIHIEIMPRIEYHEIMGIRTEESKDNKKVSNYSTVIDFINNLTLWIAYDILGRANLNSRVKALSYYINVAIHCLELHDYNGAWAIYGATGLHIIQKLTGMWEKLPKKDLSLFKKLEMLFEPRLNFMEYRKRYESDRETSYAIPVLALISMDIIRYEIEPTFVDRKIDFNKMRKIYSVIQSLSHNNITPLHLGQEYTKIDRLWNWLWNYKDVDEVKLEKMAQFIIEQKGNNSPN